jgi:hypothetical protein
VAHGGDQWAPYRAASTLIAWAAENWGLIDGHCLAHGTDLNTLRLPRILNVVYWYLVEHSDEAQAKTLAELHTWPVDATPEARARSWGSGSSAQSAQQAMMGDVGALYIDDAPRPPATPPPVDPGEVTIGPLMVDDDPEGF